MQARDLLPLVAPCGKSSSHCWMEHGEPKEGTMNASR